MTLDRELAIRVFEEKIETLNRAMPKAKDTQAYRALESERAEVVKALAEFVEKQDEELAEFQKKEGKNAAGRAVNLPHDWWNDEETDSDQVLESPHDSCDGEDLGKLFNGGSIDRDPGQVALIPPERCKNEAEDPCRLRTPFDDRWNDDDLVYE